MRKMKYITFALAILILSVIFIAQEIPSSRTPQQIIDEESYIALKSSLDNQLQSNNPSSQEINSVFEKIYNGQRETTLFQQLTRKDLRKLWDSLTDENKRNMFGLRNSEISDRGLNNVYRMELWRELQYDSSGKLVKSDEVEKKRSEFLEVLTNEQKTEMTNLILETNKQSVKTAMPTDLVISKVEYKMGDRSFSNPERVILITQLGAKVTIPLDNLPEGLKEYNINKLIGNGIAAVAVFGDSKDPNTNRVFLKNGDYVSATRFASPSDRGKEDFDIEDANGKYLFSANFRGTSKNKIFNDNGKYQIWGNG